MYTTGQNRDKSQISNRIVTQYDKMAVLDTFPHENMQHSHNILYTFSMNRALKTIISFPLLDILSLGTVVKCPIITQRIDW